MATADETYKSPAGLEAGVWELVVGCAAARSPTRAPRPGRHRRTRSAGGAFARQGGHESYARMAAAKNSTSGH